MICQSIWFKTIHHIKKDDIVLLQQDLSINAKCQFGIVNFVNSLNISRCKVNVRYKNINVAVNRYVNHSVHDPVVIHLLDEVDISMKI